ncbi:DNA/RNA helicase domain-containing protein [Bacillus albus]|uniref:DNA/RNA helicase domain-containing protein n=1 Tax=Bacillus albus TaxID=2026189 RepID=UPI00209F7D74|nr:DNA/RNA helicase domain-containing protein [Bacillus albus]
MEFDYVGLIFWDDLYYDSTSKLWKVTLKDNYDNSFINEIARAYGGTFIKYNRTVIYNGQQYQIDDFIEKVNATNVVSELVMNIYRVLLSRGKKGLYIWFKDVKTKLYFIQQFSQIS